MLHGWRRKFPGGRKEKRRTLRPKPRTCGTKREGRLVATRFKRVPQFGLRSGSIEGRRRTCLPLTVKGGWGV